MIILGIDPGSVNLGWGLIEEIGSRVKLKEYGCIQARSKDPHDRLLEVYKALKKLIQQFKPDCLSVEKLFFGANVKTAMAIGETRGVILLSAKQLSISISEYTPLQIKMAVTGYGRADKRQMQDMVKMYFGLKKIPKPSHAADALAVAICHLNSKGLQNKINETLRKQL